ncbi:MAG: protein-L-isoaspartate(D-aspartate) O-methyltransferase [Sinobacteraceae bacterium]|nr:protein-L-isoaspartate(D-aspartate) O-methyltransferase [Nevskiaceae bacterium]
MIEELRRDGIDDERVLDAMAQVPRERFVDPAWRVDAWKNRPLPIGHSQTISQPYIVALMTQLLLAKGTPKRVLEVGTGSGYQCAVLARLVERVYSVERIRSLSEQARKRLRDLGLKNIHFGYADGSVGWSAHAPYDGIVVTAAAPEIPETLRQQLAAGGRMVIPVGNSHAQELKVVDRGQQRFRSRSVASVSFVPLLAGRA